MSLELLWKVRSGMAATMDIPIVIVTVHVIPCIIAITSNVCLKHFLAVNAAVADNAKKNVLILKKRKYLYD